MNKISHHNHPSPLRYPGGKSFLAAEFSKILNLIGFDRPVYIEPYAGGAGAALKLLFSDKVEKVIINDFDPAIYAFWKSVTDYSEKFANKVLDTSVTLSEWDKQKKIYLDKTASIFEKGFATFFLNRTNRSGIMNASPIGGRLQRGDYKIDARYNKGDLVAKILKIGEYRNRIEVVKEDGVELVTRYLGRKNTFIYLDPPYFKKGAMLYMNHYEEDDHKKLAKVLNKNAKYPWILTYDERSAIRRLYPRRKKKRITLQYRVRDSRIPHKARELMILSDLVASRTQ